VPELLIELVPEPVNELEPGPVIELVSEPAIELVIEATVGGEPRAGEESLDATPALTLRTIREATFGPPQRTTEPV
jgi:hypothetical protein